MAYTQMEAAKAGVITRELREAAEYEGIAPEALASLVASGQAAIPANRAHHSLRARAVGRTLKTKINVNLGTSRDASDQDTEMEKVRTAIALGADAIMDLSSSGDTRTFRKKLIEASPAMIGTVPAYDAVVQYAKPLREITADEWIAVVLGHAKDGVDFQTIHCGITRETVDLVKAEPRLTGIVSRGGSLLFAWMAMTGNENPFYERFDEILEICREHEVTLSLGDACRPGSIADSTDGAQVAELMRLGALARRARARGVQVIIEGPGHMALDEIEANMALERRLCDDAPFYVLGPLVTDIAPGYDHITAAIGGTVAAAAGAAFLCYVTPAEHLRLPTLDDMREGIVASRIAAHAADIAKGIPGARDIDRKMSEARRDLDWERMFSLAIDPEKARRFRAESKPELEDSCTMCGKMCAVRNINKILKGEIVDAI
ncbi:MAG TPA: phosphomethylpyrimidine synthase ThiC [Treponemataceae bacterium]|nr:phosphomethylpyrimidine synthase ThiC [Treponemataceae bacterium]HPS43452.1 phosphomethylpyrimidine synthase ThiC [Treponemataceae bacterium]